MKVIEDLVKGPFKDEAEFKHAVMDALKAEWKKKGLTISVFEIENQEKEPGMPDVLTMNKNGFSMFSEFKITDGGGTIIFQKTQPLFYKKHMSSVYINIVVWDTRFNRVVHITPEEVVKNKSLRMKIPIDI